MFIKVDPVTFNIQKLPHTIPSLNKERHRISKIRDDLVVYSDNYDIIMYDTLQHKQISSYKNKSSVVSMKRVEAGDKPTSLFAVRGKDEVSLMAVIDNKFVV